MIFFAKVALVEPWDQLYELFSRDVFMPPDAYWCASEAECEDELCKVASQTRGRVMPVGFSDAEEPDEMY